MRFFTIYRNNKRSREVARPSRRLETWSRKVARPPRKVETRSRKVPRASRNLESAVGMLRLIYSGLNYRVNCNLLVRAGLREGVVRLTTQYSWAREEVVNYTSGHLQRHVHSEGEGARGGIGACVGAAADLGVVAFVGGDGQEVRGGGVDSETLNFPLGFAAWLCQEL